MSNIPKELNIGEVKAYMKSAGTAYTMLWNIFKLTMMKVKRAGTLAEAKSLANEALVILNKEATTKKKFLVKK